MGIGLGLRHRNSYSSDEQNNVNENINPNPFNFIIMKSATVNNNCMIWVKYLNCVNYEGNKILIYKKIALSTILNQRSLDPHFSHTEFISPFIRIEPTDAGWKTGLQIMELF